MRQRGSGRAGFTLIELMISLVIIAVMAMTIAPSLQEMQASSRQTGAAMDLVRMARRVRAQALATGVAYLLRFRGTGDGSSNGLGHIAVHMGMNAKCMQTPWGQAFAANADDAHLEARDQYDMVDYNPTDWIRSTDEGTPPDVTDDDRQVIQLVARIGTTDSTGLLLCYQPNGEIFMANGATSVAVGALAPQTLPVTFTINRSVNRTVLGRPRAVIFPPGGSARSL